MRHLSGSAAIRANRPDAARRPATIAPGRDIETRAREGDLAPIRRPHRSPSVASVGELAKTRPIGIDNKEVHTRIAVARCTQLTAARANKRKPPTVRRPGERDLR